MNYCGFLKTNATSGLLNYSSAEFSVDSLNPKFSDNCRFTSIFNFIGVWNSKFIISSVEYDDIKLTLYKPLFIQYYKNDYGYYCDYEYLDIHSYGETLAELKKSFEEDLVVAWKLYVECDESILSPDAKELRKKILEVMKRE
jgi:hypothetical protein